MNNKLFNRTLNCYQALLHMTCVLCVILFGAQAHASAMNEVYEVDVTPYSFSLLVRWSTEATINVELFSDVDGLAPAQGSISYNYTDGDEPSIGNAARLQGLLRARIVDLLPNTPYFYQVTVTPTVGQTVLLPLTSPLNSVRTAVASMPVNNPTVSAMHLNDSGAAVDGSVLMLDVAGAAYPLTGLTGDGYPAGTVAVTLNNLLDPLTHQNLQLVTGSSYTAFSYGGGESNGFSVGSINQPTPQGVAWALPASPIVLSAIVDSDGDGMPDDFENLHNLDPAIDDSAVDGDGDGLSNLEEYLAGTDPNNIDSDNDGLSDGDEINLYGSLANETDTDQDGLSDGDEINLYQSNALDADSDDDGVNDGLEIELGGDPNDASNTPIIDTDGDGVADDIDNCLIRPNPLQINTDGDEYGDDCDVDDDNDGIDDVNDNSPLVANVDQLDGDADGAGDVSDNCLLIANPSQVNTDGDSFGDACDDDDDNDGVNDYAPIPPPSSIAHVVTNVFSLDELNVAAFSNPNAVIGVYKQDLRQVSGTPIRLGDINLASRTYEPFDLQPDEVSMESSLMLVWDIYDCDCAQLNGTETLTLTTTYGQVTAYLQSTDSWGTGGRRYVAIDGSLYAYASNSVSPVRLNTLVFAAQPQIPLDNCRIVPNPDQLDVDGDGRGDLCDVSPDDLDGDGVANQNDNCPSQHNSNQDDFDSDGIGDLCDSDADNDGLSNSEEILFNTNPLMADTNGDGVLDAAEDSDFDGINNLSELLNGTDPLSAQLELSIGMNLIHYAIDVPDGLTAFDLLEVFGGFGVVQSIERSDPLTEEVMRVSYVDAAPAGDNFYIEPSRGYAVNMLQSRTHDWGGVVKCRTVNIPAGKNLVGFGCAPSSADAHAVLDALSSDQLVALEGIDTASKFVQSSGVVNGEVVGENFALSGTQAFIAHTDGPISTDYFEVIPAIVQLFGLTDGAVVSNNVLDIAGFVSGSSDYVTINGVAVTPSDLNPGEFSLAGLNLVEGPNEILIRVLASNGQISESTLTIVYAVPPELEITSHYDGQRVNSEKTTIEGTVNGDTVTVLVNGVSAVVQGSAFVLEEVVLEDGPNVIEVTATASNGGSVTKEITIESSPIVHVLRTGGFSQYSVYASFTLTLPENVYASGATYNVEDNSPSFITFTAQSLTSIPPQTWEYDYRIEVDSNAEDEVGQHDFTVTYNIFDSQDAVVRSDTIRYRVVVVTATPLIVFDQDYDFRTVTTDSIAITGWLYGQATEFVVNGINVPVLVSGSYLQARQFSVEVPLPSSENFIDFNVLFNEVVIATEELLIFVESIGPLSVEILTPRGGDVYDQSVIEVTGTVSDEFATLFVNGAAVSVVADGNGGGTYTTNVDLVDGPNTIEARISVGEFAASKSIRVVKGPFAFHIERLKDYDVVSRRNTPYYGTASVPLQSVYTEIGTSSSTNAQSGTDWFVGSPGGGSPYFSQNGEDLQRVTFTATDEVGNTVQTSLLLSYKPVVFDLPSVYRGDIEIEYLSSVPQDLLDQSSYWRFRQTSIATSPDWVVSSPVLGRVRPLEYEQLGGGRVRLSAASEVHGTTVPGEYTKYGQSISFYDSDDNELATEYIDVIWKLTASDTKEIFVTGYSDGQTIDHFVADVFGVMANIEAQEVRVNGESVNFNETEFWDDQHHLHPGHPIGYFIGVPLVKGPNSILIEADDVDGQTYSTSMVINYHQARVTMLPNQTKTLNIRLHQRDPDNYSINMFTRQRPSQFVSYTNPSSFDASLNTGYYRPNPLPDYYNHLYRPKLDFNSTSTLDVFGNTGIYDMFVDITGDFGRATGYGLWLNLLDPNNLTPEPLFFSHTDGDDVPVGTVTLEARIYADGFSTMTVDGGETAIEYQSFPDPCDQYQQCRVRPVYSITVPVVAGQNVYQIDAVGSRGDEYSGQFTLNGVP